MENRIELQQPMATRETEKAVCFTYPDGHLKDRDVWVPKSLLTTTDDGVFKHYFVPRWFVKANNLWRYA